MHGEYPDGWDPPERHNRFVFAVHFNQLNEGSRYWFATAPEGTGQYPQGISGFWPEGMSPGFDAVFERAVRKDELRWSPNYDPGSRLTCGHLASSNGSIWQVRISDDDRVWWTRAILGKPAGDGYAACHLRRGSAVLKAAPLDTAVVLYTETADSLVQDNEWELPAGAYYIRQEWSAKTGRILSARVRSSMSSDVDLRVRAYDPETGAVSIDKRTP
jgi:hypothetical protein